MHPKYRIYLLTVWQEEQAWCFLLEEPRTGSRRGFTSTAKLVDALLEGADSSNASSPTLDDSNSAPFSEP